MWKHQRTRQAIISFWREQGKKRNNSFPQQQKVESFGFSWIMEKEKIYGLALSLGEEGTAFLPTNGSFEEEGLALSFLRDHLGIAGLWKTAAVLDLGTQLDLLRVPDREKLFDFHPQLGILLEFEGRYPYEDIAKEYLSRLLPGRAAAFR